MNPNSHIFIYVQKITPRVKYIFNLILKDCLGLEFTITNNEDDYKLFEGYKFSYSKQPIESDFHIISVDLMFESGIHEQTILMQNHDDYIRYFFKTYNSILPFDMFAAAFYLVSRYEE